MVQEPRREPVTERIVNTDIRSEPAATEPLVADRRLQTAEDVALWRDHVRWGPVFAGFLIALTVLVLLSLLGLAVGATTLGAQGSTAGAAPAMTGPGPAIWAAVAGIIAFFVGGFVAGRTAAIFDRGWGAFNGAMVFFLALPLVLLLAGFGLGSTLGMLGAVAGGNMNLAQSAANQAQQAANQTSAAQISYGAWGTLIGLVLALIASAIGGAVGVRREIHVTAPATTAAHVH